MSFESRYHSFVTIGDVSLINEKVFGPLRLKHLTYFFLSFLTLWRALWLGHPQLLGFSVLSIFLAVASAIYPKKTLSLESLILAALLSLIELVILKARSVE
ncbi:MAG: hypothetical protein QN229_05965 [Desulfurococcaceae archaeon TW002]